MNFQERMEIYTAEVDAALQTCIPKQSEFPPILFESMRYSVFAGGKRIRPILLLAACEAVGGNKQIAMPFACAIELIHTYSLIHDDLPAMDDDDYRRGKLTNHKMYGEDIAILTGDGLLHHAMQIMAQSCYELPCKETTGAMLAIAEGAGVDGMLIGQVVDVYLEGKPLDAQILDFMHIHKTAAMIRGALRAGARMGSASEDIVEQFALAGEKIGIAFQILDDILDVTSTVEALGKPIHSDQKNNKTTYVTLHGLEESKKLAELFSQEAMDIWDSMGESCEFLKELTAYLLQRTY